MGKNKINSINKEFKKEFFEDIDKYIDTVNNSLKDETQKCNEQIKILQEKIYPEGEIYDETNIITKFKSWIKNRNFRSKVKGIRKKEQEYEKRIYELENIRNKWNIAKGKYEQNFIKKEKLIKNNVRHIELDWIKRVEIKNTDKDKLREIESPLLILIDDNEWHTYEGITDRFYQDPIYGNYHFIDPKKMRSWKLGNQIVNVYVGDIHSLFLYPIEPLYDARTFTGYISDMLAQIEKLKNLNNQDKTKTILIYIAIAVGIIVALIILFRWVLPAIFPEQAAKMATQTAQIAVQGTETVVDANTAISTAKIV